MEDAHNPNLIGKFSEKQQISPVICRSQSREDIIPRRKAARPSGNFGGLLLKLGHKAKRAIWIVLVNIQTDCQKIGARCRRKREPLHAFTRRSAII